MAETIAYRFKLRGGTASEWASSNPVLLAREPGIETDTGAIKLGDGTSTWNNLPYSGRNTATLLAEAQTAAGQLISAEDLPTLRDRVGDLELNGGGGGTSYDDTVLRQDMADADSQVLKDAKLYADGADSTLSGRLDTLEGRPKSVVLTQVQYDGLGTKDSNTLYFIRS